jgi:hypothetical protein
MLRFQALVNPATGDLVSLEEVTVPTGRKRQPSEEVKPGAVWMPNRMVFRQSGQRTSYQCFPGGKYDRMRAGWHMIQRYGTRNRKPGTEAQRLARDDGQILLTVVQLMSQGASLTRRDLWLAESVGPLVEEYAACYDIRKVMARQDLERGKRLKDARGRDNVGAAAMALGAARGNVQLREQAIVKLERYMEARAQETADEIRRIRDTYRLLWCGFHPRVHVYWAHEDAGLEPPLNRQPEGLGWLATLHDKTTWADMARALRWQLPIFRKIRALPFCHNAAHVVHDLQAALQAVETDDVSLLEECLTRLREGMRWFFALDYLQTRIINPLALIIEDLRIAHHGSPVPGIKPHGKFVPSIDMAPGAFLEIVRHFGEFVRRMYRPLDHLLDNPVRDRIEELVTAVENFMRDDQWLKAKANMLRIADNL